jgi:hypothetical protein
MPQNYYEYTIEKLVSFRHQIIELLGSDFPIPSTKQVLEAIQAVFLEEEKRLLGLSNLSNDVKKAACAHVNVKIKDYLPLLGFILRSTNVRNAFELADPVTRLSKQILNRDLTFVLSSEWNFSPLTYTISFSELPDVIFLGLPAFESGNALIIPLAGHELGHWIWRHRNLETQISISLQDHVLNFLSRRMEDFPKAIL